MVKFNFWDKFLTKNPKRFRKTTEEQIKSNTLLYLQKYGRKRWISTAEIFEKTLEKTEMFNSSEGKMFFASQGIKSKVNSATGKLRRLGHPIIAGVKGKGYMYADENCDNFVDVWNEKFSAFEGRKNSLKAEAKNDKQLIKKIIERLLKQNRIKEAQRMEEVLVMYN